MQNDSGSPDFMKTVGQIHSAEETYDRIIASAKEKSDRLLRSAKEAVLDSRTRQNEELVNFKTQRLQAGAKSIDSEVDGVLAIARDEAAKASKKSLDDSTVAKITKEFLNSL